MQKSNEQVADKQKEDIRRIAKLEQDLWTLIFSYRSKAGSVAKRILSCLNSNPMYKETAEVRTLLATVQQKPKSPRVRENAPNTHDEAISALPELLLIIDKERDLVAVAKEEIIRRGTRKREGATPTLSSHATRIQHLARKIETEKHRFIQSNQRLVVMIAQRYKQNRGQTPLADLVQEGNIGLIKGLNRFDHRQEVRFATYASWWIRSCISRALMKKGNEIRLPASAIRRINAIKNAENTIQKKTGHAPSEEDIARETGIDQSKLDDARRPFITTMCSLDESIPSSNPYSYRYIDIIEDEDSENPFDAAMLKIWSGSLEEHLQVLTPKERTVISLRFGLNDSEEMTLENIGQIFGLCRERIRQIEGKALLKLRQQLDLVAA
ncbi:MAG: sigma-70 family RNA polymerase sigma factor [Proteobacteria bacterium]|nr:sigma-70 family RNA polymerase sigma factor [Pseudomonadota bacterium]